jgi:uncharacterized membrane protein YdbT with pleckstrin-like domain
MSDESLMQGEEVVYQTEKHWMAPLTDSWKAILMLIGAAVVAWLQPEQTDGIMGFVGRLLELARLGLLFGGLLWIVYNILNWRVAWVKVTNLRVLGQEGLLRRKETDSLLSSISDVRTKVSFTGRSLKYGDITIFTASGEAGADTFTSMKDADRLKKVILEQKTKQTGAFATAVGVAAGAGDGTHAPSGSAAANQTETMATLSSLGKLRDSGVITPEEFETKKQELLSRI